MDTPAGQAASVDIPIGTDGRKIRVYMVRTVFDPETINVVLFAIGTNQLGEIRVEIGRGEFPVAEWVGSGHKAIYEERQATAVAAELEAAIDRIIAR